MIHILMTLQLLDVLTTHYVLRTGIGTEANPVLRKLFDKFGHEPRCCWRSKVPSLRGCGGWCQSLNRRRTSSLSTCLSNFTCGLCGTT